MHWGYCSLTLSHWCNCARPSADIEDDRLRQSSFGHWWFRKCEVECIIMRKVINWGMFCEFEVWGFCNIGYLSKIHLKAKFCKISFTHNFFLCYPNILKFEHRIRDCQRLHAKFQNDWATEMYTMNKWDFTRFDFVFCFVMIIVWLFGD